MFDDQNSIIGVIPAPPRSAEAFPLKKKNGSNWVVNAAPFCCHFRISPHETERFDDPDLDDEGILRLDLKRTHNVTRRKRREKARTA